MFFAFKSSRRRTIERFGDLGWIRLSQLSALLVLVLLGAIAAVILVQAIPAIKAFGLSFLWTSTWNPVEGRERYGILPMIYGTLVSSTVALSIAVPLGVGTAIFLSEDFILPQIRAVLVFMVELLAAIPSVVYGLWGLFVLVPLMQVIGTWLHNTLGWIPLFSTAPAAGLGMLPAGVVLAIMILPIITAISRDSLAVLPTDLREASLGLGATRWGTIFRVLIPSAIAGIAGGIMLALGRAMGETMATAMLIGNSNQIDISLLSPATTIASLLANQFSEAKGLQVSALMYAASVLMSLTLVVNILAEFIVNQIRAKYE